MADTDVKLQVLICTFGLEGLGRVAANALPEVPGVAYIVSCQDPGGTARGVDIAALTGRHDCSVHFFADKGLSINRNHSLDLASAPYILIADDDITFNANGLKAIIQTFDDDPSLDLATFKSACPDKKSYPPGEHNLRQPYRGYFATSFEIAFRRRSLVDTGLRFSPLAGIGAPYLHAGEEIFMVDKALKRGFKGRFFPILIAVHPGATTSFRLGRRPGVARAKGAILYIQRGWLTGLTRVPVEAWRSPLPFLKALLYISQGYIYAIIHRKEL